MKNKLIMLVGVLFFTFSSCSDISEVNVDPNNPVTVPAELLNTQSQYMLSNRIWSRLLNAEWSMLVVQHWAQNEYAEESRYTVDGNDFDVPFVELYVDVLSEIKTARETVEATEGLTAGTKANQLATLSILEVYTYHILTDLFGDIPYLQALQPIDFPSPSYDSQSTIYAGLVTTLDKAIAAIDTNSPGFESGDVIYGGNAAMWKKLGNSLMLRIAMRMSDVDSGAASSAISSISGSFIESNDENALFIFDGNAQVANPLYIDAVINSRDDFAVTDVLVTTLQDTGDPRLSAFAAVNNSGEYLGMAPGLPDADAFADKPFTSRPNPDVRTATAPAVLMDYAEVQFLLAEAYERGFLTGDAETAYNEGITASMNYWGFSDATAISDYLAANAYDASNWKESLGTQKWLAFYMNGTQAWAEWRRLDYPVLAVPAAATNPSIPVRLPYPISEQTRNAAALNAVTSTPNDLNGKMWWDVN